jgi:hypothetical protein
MGLNALRRLSRTIPELQPRTKDVKKFFSTAAIIAALASAVPASAQHTGPGPTVNAGTGPGVLPPEGFGPSSPLYNLNEEPAASARCGPLSSTFGFSLAARSHGPARRSRL